MRVTRSFAFTDLCGFTRYTDAHGDEQAVAVLGEFRSLVRDVGQEFGVRVAKWLGDGAMFVSIEPWHLVAMIVSLQARVSGWGIALPLRTGAAHGEVILFEGDDYIGGPVNLAARLSDIAGPGDVLVAADLVPHAPEWARARMVGSWSIPGFVRPVEVASLTASTTPTLAH